VPRFVSAESVNWPGMVFSPDGRRVSLVGIDVQRDSGQEGSSQPPPQRVALVTLDAGSGKVVRRVAAGGYRRGLLGSVGVSWSGRYAAGVFFEPTGSGRVRLWRLDDGRGGWQSPPQELSRSYASRIEFSSDDTVLKAGARWWDAWTGKPLSAGRANRQPWLRGWGARTVVSPDGTQKAGWDAGKVTVADAASGRVVRVLPADLDPGRVVGPWFHFSRSGRRLAMLATGRDDTRLRVWQVGTGERILTVDWSRLGTRSAWSPDERTLAVSTDGSSLNEGDGFALFHVP
jgi:hypothetical protein